MKHSIRIAAATVAVLALAACSQTGGDAPAGAPFGPGYAMMGGYGMMGPGSGMMGPGYGMMGGWGSWGGVPADLTAEQRRQIAEIEREQRGKQWPLMRQMHEVMWADGGAFDEQAQRRDYEQIAALQKQMFENMLEARRRVDAVLTQQQREQLRSGARASR
jgi:Spy/CpxP family protein refolding chaperone